MKILSLRVISKIRILIRKIKKIAISPLYFGFRRYCPVCKKYSNKFLKAGLTPREDALCFFCHSEERHRFVWLYMKKKTNLFNNGQKKMLHVAPEYCFKKRFRKLLGDSYITADLYDEKVMIKMDITDIKIENNFFDFIYCSHVLEHVEDDRKALREFYRVLKVGGIALILVPITGEETYEDPFIVSPEERLTEFGQEDHVRRYGLDITKRIEESGFRVQIINVEDIATENEAVKMGLTVAAGEIFFCKK